MEIFWAVIASIVVLMILYGIVSSRIDKRKPVFFGNLQIENLGEMLQKGRPYTLFINTGARFEDVKILGFAEDRAQYVTQRWLVLERPDGSRVFLKPERILWISEGGAGKAAPSEPPASSPPAPLGLP